MIARLRGLWRREPVLVGSVLPVLVTLGVLTQSQASTVTNVIAGVASVVGELAVSFGVRSKVSPAAKQGGK